MVLLAIAFGGAMGAMGRFALSTWANQRFRLSPAGTLLVNLTGALALGMVVALGEDHLALSTTVRHLVVTGVLGSYTTFSTLYFETFTLIETEKPTLAVLYAIGSQAAGVLAIVAGMALVGIL